MVWGCCGWNGSEDEEADGTRLSRRKRGSVHSERRLGPGLYNVSLAIVRQRKYSLAVYSPNGQNTPALQ